MSTRLRSYDTSPPGGYVYDQPPPKPRRFPAQPLIEAQARLVQGYRKGNGLARQGYAECLEDVDRYTCARLGGSSKWCVEINAGEPAAIALQANAPGLVPCKGCGNPV